MCGGRSLRVSHYAEASKKPFVVNGGNRKSMDTGQQKMKRPKKGKRRLGENKDYEKEGKKKETINKNDERQKGTMKRQKDTRASGRHQSRRISLMRQNWRLVKDVIDEDEA